MTPVCPVESAGKIYWASDTDTAKLANTARHPSVALVADTYKADWRQMGGVMAQGRARIIKEGPLFRKVRGLLYRKFRGYESNAGWRSRWPAPTCDSTSPIGRRSAPRGSSPRGRSRRPIS